MEFTKLQGTGNDFILINQSNKQTAEILKKYSEAAQKLCDRHYGIGADGLITVLRHPSDGKPNRLTGSAKPPEKFIEVSG